MHRFLPWLLTWPVDAPPEDSNRSRHVTLRQKCHHQQRDLPYCCKNNGDNKAQINHHQCPFFLQKKKLHSYIPISLISVTKKWLIKSQLLLTYRESKFSRLWKYQKSWKNYGQDLCKTPPFFLGKSIHFQRYKLQIQTYTRKKVAFEM